ncbi:MAG: hypothetical protein K2J63_05220 [Muribaculaceae bacterium]|nr:hypothetical protein [Muribaculaceae bacterium]
MKYIKIFALAVGMFSMVACSDDKKDHNTAAEVEVEMGESQVITRENRGIFNVPVNLTGKANGTVTVTIDVEATGSDPAQEAQLANGNRVGNYIITSKTLNIPEGVTSVNVQINAIDDDEVNEDRTFKIVIVKAEGASIDKSKDSTLVTIKDDDRFPYEKLQGEWTLSWKDLNSGEDVSYPVTLEGYTEDKVNYNKVLMLQGLFSSIFKDEESVLNLKYFFDEATEECYLELDYAQAMGQINPDLYPQFAGCTVYNFGIDDEGYLIDEGYVEGVVSDDRKTVVFTPDASVLYCFPYQGQYQLIDGGYSLVLSRN